MCKRTSLGRKASQSLHSCTLSSSLESTLPFQNYVYEELKRARPSNFASRRCQMQAGNQQSGKLALRSPSFCQSLIAKLSIQMIDSLQTLRWHAHLSRFKSRTSPIALERSCLTQSSHRE